MKTLSPSLIFCVCVLGVPVGETLDILVLTTNQNVTVGPVHVSSQSQHEWKSGRGGEEKIKGFFKKKFPGDKRFYLSSSAPATARLSAASCPVKRKLQ